MSEKIEPALTAEEWALYLPKIASDQRGGVPFWNLSVDSAASHGAPALIALSNAVFRDDDRRKITRKKINILRMIVSAWDGCGMDPDARAAWLADKTETALAPDVEYLGDKFDLAVGNFLDALESYLPPET